MNMKQHFDLESAKLTRRRMPSVIAALLRECANRASDHRLARRRLSFERHPLNAPHQTMPPQGAARGALMSAVDCEREARSAERAGQFAAAATWWAAAATAETAALTSAVEAGQWQSQAAYERYARAGNQRVDAYARHRRAAEETADVITRHQAAHPLSSTRS